jgi:hypothetical protein
MRNGKLADPKKSIGVTGPFHLQLISEVERNRNIFPDEVIHDGPVIDAMDRD